MFTSRQNSSPKIRTLISQQPLFSSQENSLIYRQAYSDQNFKHQSILNEERYIVKDNLDKLKNLLSENKQFAKRNRADISPERGYRDKSRDNLKYCTPNNERSSKSKIYQNSQQKSRDFLSPIKISNESLVADIKRKIQGSPSPSRYHGDLAEVYMTKNIVRPQTTSLYGDNLVNPNKQINLLVKQNQKYQSKIQDQDAQINQLNKKINQLENKLENMVTLAQQNEEKFHSIMFDKEEQLRAKLLEKQELELETKSSLEHFQNFYFEKIAYLTKKFKIKITNIENRLENIQSKSLVRIQKKVRLQKFIFQSESPYRKSKNYLQKSPSVKGDQFQELQQQRHQVQKQMFERQVKYEKNKYEKTIKLYKQNYDDLREKFVQAQKRNDILRSEILIMRNQQQNFIKKYEQNQRKLEQERKSNQKKLEQEKREKENQHNYFKNQMAQLKMQQDFQIQEKQHMTVKSLLNTPKNLSISRQSPKSLYLKLNQDKYERSDRIKESEKQTQNVEEVLKQKEKQLLERQIDVQLKEKMLQIKQKQFQEQVKIKQQYFDELNHIKTILKTIHQSKAEESESIIIKKDKTRQNSKDQKSNQSSKSPSTKLKQISKAQYLAKKQKKQKEIAQYKLQTLERQLQYQRVKNNQLQYLIGQKENKLFYQIKEIVSSIENQPQCQQMDQSIIHEEQMPFDPMLISLEKQKHKNNFGTIENQVVQDWQSKVKDRLENAIQRLQVLENLSSSRLNKKGDKQFDNE